MAILVAATFLYCVTSGFLTLLALTILLAALPSWFEEVWLRVTAADAARRERVRELVPRASLAMGGLGAGLLLVEAGLALLGAAGRMQPGGPPRWITDISFPGDWEMRQADVPGARNAFNWQGHLHLQNAEGFRTLGDYAGGRRTFRIAVLGDSFTYGYGVAAEEAHPAVLERLLSRKSRVPVHVYNLGVPTYNSSDVLQVARKWVPRLRPHLVVYGICMNDIEPSRTRHLDDMRWQLPVPSFLVDPIAERTLAGKLWTREYDTLLRSLEARDDFLTNVFRDFDSRLVRFRKDLRELNEVCAGEVGQPVIALVLNETPRRFEVDRTRLVRLIEQVARDAQMDVVPSMIFLDKGSSSMGELTVSRWEGHPSSVAHRIWGEKLATAIEELPRFRRFMRRR